MHVRSGGQATAERTKESELWQEESGQEDRKGQAERHSEAWVLSAHVRVMVPSRLSAVLALSRHCHPGCRHQPQNCNLHCSGVLCAPDSVQASARVVSWHSALGR